MKIWKISNTNKIIKRITVLDEVFNIGDTDLTQTTLECKLGTFRYKRYKLYYIIETVLNKIMA